MSVTVVSTPLALIVQLYAEIMASPEKDTSVQFHVIDVDTDFAILIEKKSTQSGSKFYLFNTGSGKSICYDNLQSTLKEKLCKCDGKSFYELEAVIISHASKQHYGGLEQLLNGESKIAIKQILFPKTIENEREFMTLIERKFEPARAFLEHELQTIFESDFNFVFHPNAPGILYKPIGKVGSSEKPPQMKSYLDHPSSNAKGILLLVKVKHQDQMCCSVFGADLPGDYVLKHISREEKLCILQVPQQGKTEGSTSYEECSLPFKEEKLQLAEELQSAATLLTLVCFLESKKGLSKLLEPLLYFMSLHGFQTNVTNDEIVAIAEASSSCPEIRDDSAIIKYAKYIIDITLTMITKTRKREQTGVSKVEKLKIQFHRDLPLYNDQLKMLKNYEERFPLLSKLKSIIYEWLTFVLEAIMKAEFYTQLKAQNYLVHTRTCDFTVIAGIQVAAAWNEHHCQILFTHSHRLEKCMAVVADMAVVGAMAARNKKKGKYLFTASNEKEGELLSKFASFLSFVEENAFSTIDFTGNIKSSFTRLNHVTDILRNIDSPSPALANKSLKDFQEKTGLQRDVNLSTVLQHVIGPDLVSQMLDEQAESLEYEFQEYGLQIKEILKWKVHEEHTKFHMNETFTAVKFAVVNLIVPRGQYREIKSAELHIENARDVALSLKLNLITTKQKTTIELSRSLKGLRSKGVTLAEHLVSVVCSMWENAMKLKVVEAVTPLFGPSFVIQVLHVLPPSLSSSITQIECIFDHTMSSVTRDSSLKPIGLLFTIPSFTLITISGISLSIKRLSLDLSANGIHSNMKLTGDMAIEDPVSEVALSAQCSFSLGSFPEVILKLKSVPPDLPSLLRLLKLQGISAVGDSYLPIIGKKLNDIVLKSVSLTMQKNIVGFSSILIETGIQVESLNLPFPIHWTKNCDVHVLILKPFSKNIAVGIRAFFFVEVPINSCSASLDASFEIKISRSQMKVKGSVLSLKPSFRNNSQTPEMKGEDILELLKAAVKDCKEIGSQFIEKLCKLSIFSTECMKAVSLKTFQIKQNDEGIPSGFHLELLFTEISIMQTIKVKNGILEFQYTPKVLHLSCKGTIVIFGTCEIYLQFTLPTSHSEGVMVIDNPDKTLILSRFVSALGWSSTLDNLPFVDKCLDAALNKLHLRLRLNGTTTYISRAEVTLQISQYTFESDVSPLSLSQLIVSCIFEINEVGEHNVQLSISGTIGGHKLSLKYDPESKELQGEGCVDPQGVLNAMRVFEKKEYNFHLKQIEKMKTLKEKMKTLNEESGYREILESRTVCHLNIVFGIEKIENSFIADLKYIGSNISHIWSAETMSFQIKDFQAEYTKIADGNELSHTGRLIGVMQARESGESTTLELDIEKTKSKSDITAQVYPGPDGKTFTLRSIFNTIIKCPVPELPNIPGIPSFFDISLDSGTLFMTPKFNITSFSLTIEAPPWELIKDPNITLQRLHFTANWSEGCQPKCCLSTEIHIGEYVIKLEGEIDRSGVVLKLKTLKCSNTTNPTLLINYDTILKELPPPDGAELTACRVPQNVELPSDILELKEFTIELKEEKTHICFDWCLEPEWRIGFGSSVFTVIHAGGRLEVDKKKSLSASYKAQIYGSLNIGKLNVRLALHLGTKFSSTLKGEIQPSDDASFSKIGNYLMGTQGSLSSVMSNLTPKKVDAMTSSSKALALFNIPKRNFLFIGKLQDWGSATLVVGKFKMNKNIQFAFMFEMQNFQFEWLADDLKYLDHLIHLRYVKALISTVENQTFSQISKSFNVDIPPEYQTPKYTCAGLAHATNTCVEEKVLKKGLVFIADLDLQLCRKSKNVIGHMYDIAEAGELGVMNLSVIITATKEVSSTKPYILFTLETYMKELKVIGGLNLENIEVRYEAPRSKESHLHLSADVCFESHEFGSLRFVGTFDIDKDRASFAVKKPSDDKINDSNVIEIPVSLQRLELRVEYNFKSREIPFVEVVGEISALRGAIEIGAIVLFQKTEFKLFMIKITKTFSMSKLLKAIGFEWPFGSKDERSEFIDIQNGVVHYAKKDIVYQDELYESGCHLKVKMTLHIFQYKFNIWVGGHLDFKNMPPTLTIWGQREEKVTLGDWIEVSDDKFTRGPILELEICCMKPKLSLIVGVSFGKNKKKRFVGKISFDISLLALTGEICYCGSIGFLKNPTLGITWSILTADLSVELPVVGKIPLTPTAILKTISKWIATAAREIIWWDFLIKLKLKKNPDPNKYLLQLVIQGSLKIYFRIKVVRDKCYTYTLPLPDIPINIPNFKELRFEEIPNMILETIMTISEKIACWLYGKVKNVLPNIFENVCKTVAVAGKKISNLLNKCCNFFKAIRGNSYWIEDESGQILAYIFGEREGKKLFTSPSNEERLCIIIGPLISLVAIQMILSDVITNTESFKESGNIEYKLKKEDESSIEELKQAKPALEKNLEGLKRELFKVEEIVAELIEEAEVTERIVVTWKMENKELDDDEGDMEHSVHILATAVVYDDGFKISSELYKEVFQGSEKKTTLKCCEIEIKNPLFVIIGIQSGITMLVKALPDRENEESDRDTQRKNIEERGREKEVMISGDFHYRQKGFANTVPFSLRIANTFYDCSNRCIECKVDRMSELQFQCYLMQVVDESNATIVVCQDVFQPNEPQHLNLPQLFELPNHSHGPYHVRALGIVNLTDRTTTETFSFSEEKIHRLLSPTDVKQTFNDTTTENEISLQSQGRSISSVMIQWNSPDINHQTKYKYHWKLISKTDKFQPESVNKTDKSQSERVLLSDDIENLYEVKVKVPFKDILKHHFEGSSLQFKVYTTVEVFKDQTVSKLESVPAEAPVFYILLPPQSLNCKFEDWFVAEWDHASYVSSYTIVLRDTCNVNASPIYEKVPALESLSCDDKQLKLTHKYIFRSDHDIWTSNTGARPKYSLEIFSEGDMSEYLKSTLPTRCDRLLQPIDIQLKYDQENDCLKVLIPSNINMRKKFKVCIIVKQHDKEEKKSKDSGVGLDKCVADRGFILSNDKWTDCIFKEETWRESVFPGESIAVWVSGSISENEITILACGMSNSLTVISSVTQPKSAIHSLKQGSIDVISMACDFKGEKTMYHYGLKDVKGKILFCDRTDRLNISIRMCSVMFDMESLSYSEFQCYVQVPTSSEEFVGAYNKEPHTYQCIVVPNSLGMHQVIYNSVLLTHVLCYKQCSTALKVFHTLGEIEVFKIPELHVHHIHSHNKTIFPDFHQDLKRWFLIGATEETVVYDVMKPNKGVVLKEGNALLRWLGIFGDPTKDTLKIADDLQSFFSGTAHPASDDPINMLLHFRCKELDINSEINKLRERSQKEIKKIDEEYKIKVKQLKEKLALGVKNKEDKVKKNLEKEKKDFDKNVKDVKRNADLKINEGNKNAKTDKGIAQASVAKHPELQEARKSQEQREHKDTLATVNDKEADSGTKENNATRDDDSLITAATVTPEETKSDEHEPTAKETVEPNPKQTLVSSSTETFPDGQSDWKGTQSEKQREHKDTLATVNDKEADSGTRENNATRDDDSLITAATATPEETKSDEHEPTAKETVEPKPKRTLVSSSTETFPDGQSDWKGTQSEKQREHKDTLATVNDKEADSGTKENNATRDDDSLITAATATPEETKSDEHEPTEKETVEPKPKRTLVSSSTETFPDGQSDWKGTQSEKQREHKDTLATVNDKEADSGTRENNATRDDDSLITAATATPEETKSDEHEPTENETAEPKPKQTLVSCSTEIETFPVGQRVQKGTRKVKHHDKEGEDLTINEKKEKDINDKKDEEIQCKTREYDASIKSMNESLSNQRKKLKDDARVEKNKLKKERSENIENIEVKIKSDIETLEASKKVNKLEYRVVLSPPKRAKKAIAIEKDKGCIRLGPEHDSREVIVLLQSLKPEQCSSLTVELKSCGCECFDFHAYIRVDPHVQCSVCEVDIKPPKEIICPLTQQIFKEPVLTPYGQTYERKAIEEHLKTMGMQDPRSPTKVLTLKDLKKNKDMKKKVETFYSKQKTLRKK